MLGAKSLVITSLVLLSGCNHPAKDQRITSRDTTAETHLQQAEPSKSPDVGISPTMDEVLAARQKYVVRVISFDATQQYGSEMPYSDCVRLRITNGSTLRLPFLTILTKRYDAQGTMVLSSRAPSISTAGIKPGQTVEYDYYPRGHLDMVSVKKIKVEIEQLIDPEAEQFFPELQGVKR